MGEQKSSQKLFHVQVVTLMTLHKRRPIIVAAAGLTVFFNLTRCFLQFLQEKAAIAHPSIPQFSRINYSLVIIIFNNVIQ